MSNGISNGTMELPYWGKVLLYLVKELGLPSMVVIVVLGMWVGWLDSPMQRQHKDMVLGQRVTHQLLNANGAMISRSAEQTEEMIYAIRMGCINSAKTANDRERCLKRHD